MYIVGQQEEEDHQFKAGERVVLDIGSEVAMFGTIWEFKKLADLGWMVLLFSDPGPSIVVSVDRISKLLPEEAAI